MAQGFSLSSDTVGEHTQLLTLEGQCDMSTAWEAEQWIIAALDAGRRDIIFDLRGVSMLVPSLLHVLRRGLIRAKNQSGSLTLIRPNEFLWALFEDSGLSDKIVSFPDLEHAFMQAPEPEPIH